MADATWTLAGLNEFLSDTPTDIDVIHLHATLIATAISTIARELDDKLKQTPGLILDKKFEEEALARLEPLNRELERSAEERFRFVADGAEPPA
jgi:hypothetical protein